MLKIQWYKPKRKYTLIDVTKWPLTVLNKCNFIDIRKIGDNYFGMMIYYE